MPPVTGIASFQYEPAFLASGIQLSPLTMPLADRIYSFPGPFTSPCWFVAH